MPPNIKSLATNRRPAGQSDGSDDSSAILAADQARRQRLSVVVRGMQTILVTAIVLVVLVLTWRFRTRRAGEPGFKFVYVNQDGSAREVSPEERAYLSEEFSGGDSGRPYIKSSFKSRDGWGSVSGFIERRLVPYRIKILPVHPDFDARKKQLKFDELDSHRAAGDIIEKQPDGSIACSPNPKVSQDQRFELTRKWHLAQQREREKLAVFQRQPNDEPNA